ncbi:MAG: hypothetical protein WCP66_09630 [Methylococcales bacterium]
MRKLLLVALLLVASGTAYSGGKEYTYRHCEGFIFDADDCTKCEEVNVVQIKVNKQIKSVMLVYKNKKITPEVFNGCQIFDEDTFKCEEETSDEISATHKEASLANGVFMSREGTYYAFRKEDEHYNCAIEKKSILNFFK